MEWESPSEGVAFPLSSPVKRQFGGWEFARPFMWGVKLTPFSKPMAQTLRHFGHPG